MDYGLLSGLAEGIKSGFESYKDAKRYNDQRAKEEKDREQAEKDRELRLLALGEERDARRRAAERDMKEYKAKLFEKGLIEGEDGFTLTPESMSDRDQSRRKTEAEIKKLEAEAARKSSGSSGDPYADELKQLRIAQIKGEQEARANKLKIPGMELSAGFQPSQESIEKIKAQATAQKQIEEIVDSINEELSTGGTQVIPGERKNRLAALYGDLKIKVKEAAKLGALAGPDVAILAEQLPEVTGIKAALLEKKDPGGLIRTYEGLRQRARKDVGAAAGTSGYRVTDPRAGLIAPQFTPRTNNSAAPQAGRASPGSIVSVGGKKYRVAEDGDTLVPQ